MTKFKNNSISNVKLFGPTSKSWRMTHNLSICLDKKRDCLSLVSRDIDACHKIREESTKQWSAHEITHTHTQHTPLIAHRLYFTVLSWMCVWMWESVRECELLWFHLYPQQDKWKNSTAHVLQTLVCNTNRFLWRQIMLWLNQWMFCAY